MTTREDEKIAQYTFPRDVRSHNVYTKNCRRSLLVITARARKNKRTARMLASARKDHSIPLLFAGYPGTGY